jgi:glycosyltransferase involved in cell wall biosynthesis
MRIGYLIPQFPGQTHSFFWRERQALKDLGIETCLISTSSPPPGIISHDWSRQAQSETAYLVPLSFKEIWYALLVTIKAGPIAWLRCIQVIVKADDVPIRQKLRLFALLPVVAKLVWLSEVQGWTHVHVHSCASSADIALFASMLSNISYSLTQHGPAFDTYGPNQAQKWRYSSFGIFVSDVLLQDVSKQIGNSLPQNVSVATMGVNLDEFSPSQRYTPWQEYLPCQFFTIGRLNPVKAHEDLIEAVALLVEKGFDAHLKIAGEDEEGGKGYRLQIEQTILEKGMVDRVQLLGAIDEDAMRQHLGATHVFALASLNEGTSVAIMEAMAMELPVVVTAVGGTPKLVTNGENGLLVEPRNPKAMADAIAKVLMDAQLAVNLGKAARQTIASKYHHRRSAEVLAGFLQSRNNE